jgi:hypothetical protein
MTEPYLSELAECTGLVGRFCESILALTIATKFISDGRDCSGVRADYSFLIR